MNPLAPLASLLVAAVADHLRKHPELLQEAASAVAAAVVAELPKLVDQLTDLTPWQLDDDVIDKVARAVAKQIASIIPGFGGLLGGFTGH
jgi:uncharacterized protein YigA (DUF484 family)